MKSPSYCPILLSLSLLLCPFLFSLYFHTVNYKHLLLTIRIIPSYLAKRKYHKPQSISSTLDKMRPTLMGPTLMLQTIFITYAFCNSFYNIVTVSTTIVHVRYICMPLENKSNLIPMQSTGMVTTARAKHGYVGTQLGCNLKMDSNTSRNRNMTKAHTYAESRTISHTVSQPLNTCLMSGKGSPLSCTRESDQTGSCGTQQGPNWGFGSGELIGVVQTLFQILTLPPIAMHFMIHGRRHGP